MRNRSANHSITWFDAVPQIQLQKCVGNHLQDYTESQPTVTCFLSSFLILILQPCLRFVSTYYLMTHQRPRTECRAGVVSVPESHSGGPRFKSRLGNRLA
jgi:hypothetical protein